MSLTRATEENPGGDAGRTPTVSEPLAQLSCVTAGRPSKPRWITLTILMRNGHLGSKITKRRNCYKYVDGKDEPWANRMRFSGKTSFPVMAQRQQSISNHIKKQTMTASPTPQTKESKSFPNEDTILELSDTEHKKLICRMLQDITNEIRLTAEKAKEHTDKTVEELKKIIQEHSGKINKLQESIEKQHVEIQKINNKITELDNAIGSQRSRLEQLECRLGHLEDQGINTNIAEKKSDKRI
ncbi:uncharacterized protein LOC126084693 [Elephas maximus indicus]|uniref:uncharacterized protein LOC126084693 n=1 Tax=Elephas maximus indicus TaxID=99487 RepID=UPI0021161206|nr:uncharacterized protein LOC126084693 [Elephas maximus indicus]